MAPDLIERAVYKGGDEERVDLGGGVSEVGGQEWHASEHAGPAGQVPRERPPVTYSEWAEWLIGGRAARSVA